MSVTSVVSDEAEMLVPSSKELIVAFEASPTVARTTYPDAPLNLIRLGNCGIPPPHGSTIATQDAVRDDLPSSILLQRHNRWRFMAAGELNLLLHVSFLHVIPASLASRCLLFSSLGQSSIGAAEGAYSRDSRTDAAMALTIRRRADLWQSATVDRLIFVCGDIDHWVTLCWVKGDGGCALLLFDSLRNGEGTSGSIAYWKSHIDLVETALDITCVSERIVHFPPEQRQSLDQRNGDYSCGARAVFCACLAMIASQRDLWRCEAVGTLPTARVLSADVAAGLHAFVSTNRRALLRVWPLVSFPYCSEYLDPSHPFQALLARLAQYLPATVAHVPSRFWLRHFQLAGDWQVYLHPSRYKTGRNGNNPAKFTGRFELYYDTPRRRRQLRVWSCGKTRKEARQQVLCKLLAKHPWCVWLLGRTDAQETELREVYQLAMRAAAQLTTDTPRISDAKWNEEVQTFIHA